MTWKSVEDEMPEGSDYRLLVLLRGKFPSVSYFYTDGLGEHWSSESDVWDNAYDDIVTYWMKIPELPE